MRKIIKSFLVKFYDSKEGKWNGGVKGRKLLLMRIDENCGEVSFNSKSHFPS